MLRKPGAYRKPTDAQRRLSKISKTDHARWFRSIWTDVPGASTRHHPAPFPVELASRLVRMFSFVGDTVLDPFAGIGTTLIAAVGHQRHAVGVEVDPDYERLARRRIIAEVGGPSLFREPLQTGS
jgi:site-specific DNA-methyltransferase (adenine-specific)